MASSPMAVKLESDRDTAATSLQSPDKKPDADDVPASPAAGATGVVLLPLGQPQSDRERRARHRIELDRFDTEAWTELVAEAQARPISEPATVALWEHVLATFPTAGKWWKGYAEAHMAAGNVEAVKHVFSRCLLGCPYLDLWRLYLRFIQQSKEGQPDGREDIRKAYEFALNHIGLDINAGSVWEEYIKFLKAAPAVSALEQSQRMAAVRRAAQQAVVLPVAGVELLWKDYEHFENSLSRALAKGLLAEYQPRHISARAVLRKRKKLTDRIDFSALAVPPGHSPKDEQQSVAWAQLLAFERRNPLRSPEASLAKSVNFAYDQCLMSMRRHPHVWYDYAAWHAHRGSPDAAVQVFQRALTALPDSSVLHFAYAELEESRSHVQEAKAVLERLLQSEETAGSLAHIQMMQFVRRTEGVDAARKAFMAARKAPRCSYHVHVASALMEFAMNKDPKVARNVFELGLKKHIHEPAYVLEYAEFLAKMNDDRNMRALFERALSVLPPQEAEEVWSSYIECERLYGDLASVLKLEQRKREAVSKEDEEEGPDAPTLDEVVPRYSFRDLLPCSPAELAHLGRVQALALAAEDAGQEASVARRGAEGEAGAATTSAGTAREGPPRLTVVRPDISQMAVYDPRQGFGGPVAGLAVLAAQPGLAYAPGPAGPAMPLPLLGGGAPPMLQPSMPLAMQMPPGVAALPAPAPMSVPAAAVPAAGVAGVPPPHAAGPPPLPPGPPPVAEAPVAVPGQGLEDSGLPALPPVLASFLASLPPVPGPFPEVDMVISVLLQADIPASASAEGATTPPHPPTSAGGAPPAGSAPQASDRAPAGAPSTPAPAAVPANRPPPGAKRKEPDREEDALAPSAPPPRDLYRWRLLQKTRGSRGGGGGGAGSAYSGGTYSGTPSGDRVSGSSG